MTSIKEISLHLVTALSDHGNVLLSKIVHYFGLASIGTGVAIGAATNAMDRLMTPDLWQLSDWAVIVSITGGITFIVKNLVDLYFTIKNKGRN